MSSRSAVPTIRDRLDERPSLDVEKGFRARPRGLVIRFAAGAATSIVSGAVTLAFGARVGGILLAFPAILAASLTLIEEHEGSAEAREDARGAIAGGFALAVFAVAAALALGHLNGAVALAIAAVAWLAAAISIYAIAWWRPGR
jgi:Protein of unknown function (DUF3147)